MVSAPGWPRSTSCSAWMERAYYRAGAAPRRRLSRETIVAGGNLAASHVVRRSVGGCHGHGDHGLRRRGGRLRPPVLLAGRDHAEPARRRRRLRPGGPTPGPVQGGQRRRAGGHHRPGSAGGHQGGARHRPCPTPRPSPRSSRPARAAAAPGSPRSACLDFLPRGRPRADGEPGPGARPGRSRFRTGALHDLGRHRRRRAVHPGPHQPPVLTAGHSPTRPFSSWAATSTRSSTTTSPT